MKKSLLFSFAVLLMSTSLSTFAKADDGTGDVGSPAIAGPSVAEGSVTVVIPPPSKGLSEVLIWGEAAKPLFNFLSGNKIKVKTQSTKDEVIITRSGKGISCSQLSVKDGSNFKTYTCSLRVNHDGSVKALEAL